MKYRLTYSFYMQGHNRSHPEHMIFEEKNDAAAIVARDECIQRWRRSLPLMVYTVLNLVRIDQEEHATSIG